MSSDPRLTALEHRLAALAEQVQQLAGRRPTAARGSDRPTRQEHLALVEALRVRRGARYRWRTCRAAIAYTGALSAGRGEEHLWTREHGLAALAERDPAQLAAALAALAHPLRIRLLLILLGGPRSRQELDAELDASSAGLVSHHLKELLVAGLVQQPKRNLYRLAAHQSVPVLAALAAAFDLAAGAHLETEAVPSAETRDES